MRWLYSIFLIAMLLGCTKRGANPTGSPSPTDTQSGSAQWQLTGSVRFNVGTCSRLDLISETPAVEAQDWIIQSEFGQFFATSQCETLIETISVREAQSRATFYYRTQDWGVNQVAVGAAVLSLEILPFAELSGPSEVLYSPTAVGQSLSRTLTVRNEGPSTITDWNPLLSPPFSFSAGEFPGQGGDCATLLPDQECQIEILFTPEQSGAILASLELSYQFGNQTQSLLISLSAQGLSQTGVDPDFNDGGTVALSPGTLNDRGFAVVTNDEGETFVAGSSRSPSTSFDFYVGKLLSDGTRDLSFGDGGYKIIPVYSGEDRATAIALDASGSIYLGGYGYNGSDYDFVVVRLQSNGSLDSSFGTNGIARLAVSGDDDFAMDLTLLPNGNIVLGGYSDTPTNYHFAVAVLQPNGSVEPTFDGDGWNTYAVGNLGAFGRGVVSRNGKLYLAGYAEQLDTDIALLSLNLDGSLNNAFGNAGTVLLNLGQTEYVYTLALDAEGSLVVGGTQLRGTTRHLFVARFLENGTVDPTFTPNTALPISPHSEGQSLCLDPSGAIYLAGYGWNGSNYQMLTTRLLTSGALDTLWGDGGTLIDTGTQGDVRGYGCTVDLEGRLVVVGDTRIGVGNWQAYLSRWSP